MSDEYNKYEEKKIKVFTTDYYNGVGLTYLLMTWKTENTCTFVENYYLLVRKQSEYNIKKVTIEARESTIMLFPDFDTLLHNELIPQAEYFVFNNFILPVIENNDNLYKYELPKFTEVDISRLYQIKQLCPKSLGRIREATNIKELKEYITYILTIKSDISKITDL